MVKWFDPAAGFEQDGWGGRRFPEIVCSAPVPSPSQCIEYCHLECKPHIRDISRSEPPRIGCEAIKPFTADALHPARRPFYMSGKEIQSRADLHDHWHAEP